MNILEFDIKASKRDEWVSEFYGRSWIYSAICNDITFHTYQIGQNCS